MNALKILLVIAFAFVGLLVGWGYFALMRYSLIYIGRRRGTVRFVALVLLRVLLLAGGLFGAVQVSVWCLITYTVGFIAARTMSVAWARFPRGPSSSASDAASPAAPGNGGPDG